MVFKQKANTLNEKKVSPLVKGFLFNLYFTFMAKELPYFKFEPNQWENGNIQMLSREDKGLFIDLCSIYWSRLGDLPYKLAMQKLCGGNATALNSLCDEKIIEIIDGNIFIKFLSEQLNEFEDSSKKNSKNAKEGWVKRRELKDKSEKNATALISQCENDAIREEKIKEEKKRKDKNVFTPPLISDVVLFFKENDFPEIFANKVFNYYADANWKDTNGKQVLNWKQKMRGVWFKDENKNQIKLENQPRKMVY